MGERSREETSRNVRRTPRALVAALAALACGGTSGAPPGGGGADAGANPDGGTACTVGSEPCAFLAAHDAARAAAQPAPVPPLDPLTWSTYAAQAAEAWARQCNWSHDPQLGALGLGQNLYASTFAPTAEAVVASWVSEAADYDRAANTCASGKVCGHYTQVVWRSTRSVGCAIVSCSTGSPFGQGSWWYAACDYAPPGNFVGQRPY